MPGDLGAPRSPFRLRTALPAEHAAPFSTCWAGSRRCNHVAGNKLDGLDHAHGVGCRPPIARWSKSTFVPTASVKRTSRDTGCAGIGDLHLHPKCPVAQVAKSKGSVFFVLNASLGLSIGVLTRIRRPLELLTTGLQ